jgi:hypothetical protein
MRKIQDPYLKIGEVPISEIKIDFKSRDDIPQILLGLKAIYEDQASLNKIMTILKQLAPMKNGRPGMNLWNIFVLAMVKLNLNCDYDRLHELANQHLTIRQMLGIGMFDKAYFESKTIQNNIKLFTPEILNQINVVIVQLGHRVSSKKKSLHAKCDSFVVETNVHFPTDNGLLYDAIRKVIILTNNLCEKYKIKGWRQKSHNIRKIKSTITKISKIKRSNPRKESSILQKQNNLKKAYKKLIKHSESFIEKSNLSIGQINEDCFLDSVAILEINKFINFAKIFIDQIKKRVFKKEKIPHREKIFSIFESHTEWLCKGKAKASFELGKKVAIVEDQYGFILSNKVMDRETDEKITISIIQETKKHFDNLTTCSFDKGFYSKENKEALSKLLDFPILPKKGRLSKKDIGLEHSKEFIKYRKKHSAVESAINALEVHGLDKCLDKGFYGFKRYIALAVVSRNIQKLGARLKIKAIKHLKKYKIAI